MYAHVQCREPEKGSTFKEDDRDLPLNKLLFYGSISLNTDIRILTIGEKLVKKMAADLRPITLTTSTEYFFNRYPVQVGKQKLIKFSI